MKAPDHVRTAHQADSVTSQHTWIFSNTAVKTSHFMMSDSCVRPCRGILKRFRIAFDFLILLPAVEIAKFQLWANAKQVTRTSGYSKCGVCSWLYDQFGFVTLQYWSVWFCYFIILISLVLLLYNIDQFGFVTL